MQIYCRTSRGAKKKWGIEPTSCALRRNDGTLSGSIHMMLLGILLVLFVAGGGYLYSVNRSAVQGYHMRTLEKEIDTLKQQNAELKIAEADLRSLYRIETAQDDLHMQKIDTAVYLEEREPTSSGLLSAGVGGTVALK